MNVLPSLYPHPILPPPTPEKAHPYTHTHTTLADDLFLLRQKNKRRALCFVAVVRAAAKHMGKRTTRERRGAGYRLTRMYVQRVHTSWRVKRGDEWIREGGGREVFSINKRFFDALCVLSASLFKGLTLRNEKETGKREEGRGTEGMEEEREHDTDATPRGPKQLPTQKHHLQLLLLCGACSNADKWPLKPPQSFFWLIDLWWWWP